MSQLQEETEEYVKAAFAEKDCQLKELNEEWQNRYDQLNDEVSRNTSHAQRYILRLSYIYVDCEFCQSYWCRILKPCETVLAYAGEDARRKRCEEIVRHG